MELFDLLWFHGHRFGGDSIHCRDYRLFVGEHLVAHFVFHFADASKAFHFNGTSFRIYFHCHPGAPGGCCSSRGFNV